MELDADLHRARSSGPIVHHGSQSRVILDGLGTHEESDELPGLLPFGTDGGGAVWYCDSKNVLRRGRGAVYLLAMSDAFGGARWVARSYGDLVTAVRAGLDPFSLPTFDDEASAAARGQVRLAGVAAAVNVVRTHARSKAPAEVVCESDVVIAGLSALGGAPVHLTEAGKVFHLTLAAQTVVDGVACCANTILSLHPATGRPLRFTPAEPTEVDGLPFRAECEVQRYDPESSPFVAGTLDRDHDVDGIPLAAGTHVVVAPVSQVGQARSMMSGTLRREATVAGKSLAAGTWFELVNGALLRTKPPT